MRDGIHSINIRGIGMCTRGRMRTNLAQAKYCNRTIRHCNLPTATTGSLLQARRYFLFSALFPHRGAAFTP